MQLDLFDNIAGVAIEYLVARGGFWRMGRGVGYEYDKRKHLTLAVIRPALENKRNLKLPVACVRVYEDNQTRAVIPPAPPVSRKPRVRRAR